MYKQSHIHPFKNPSFRVNSVPENYSGNAFSRKNAEPELLPEPIERTPTVSADPSSLPKESTHGIVNGIKEGIESKIGGDGLLILALLFVLIAGGGDRDDGAVLILLMLLLI